jgi:hypothetical protein
MRKLPTSSLAGISEPTSLRAMSNPKAQFHSVLPTHIEKPGSFSQVNRKCIMLKNANHARMFMDEQQRVIKDLIMQFQIFIGYREQVPDGRLSKTSDTWSVYLMHVQSLQNAMKSMHQGKPLFSNGTEPPIRVHLDDGKQVSAFDLPNPSLSSTTSIQSFLAGVLDHQLPSVELGNACLADLLNALSEIQGGRMRLIQIQNHLSTGVSSRKRLLPTHANRVGSIMPEPFVPTWYDKIRQLSQSFLSPIFNGNVTG